MGFWDQKKNKELLEIARQMFNGGGIISQDVVKEILDGSDWRGTDDLDSAGTDGSTGLPTDTSKGTSGIPQGASSGLILNRQNIHQQVLKAFDGVAPPQINLAKDTFRGWKVAQLHYGLGEARFKANVLDVYYGIKQQAHHYDHNTLLTTAHSDPVPMEECSCGFYAQKANHPNLLWDQWQGFPWATTNTTCRVVLEVELYGKVIEHEFGYRAEWQKVMAIWVPSYDYRLTENKRYLLPVVDGPIFQDVFTEPTAATVQTVNFLDYIRTIYGCEVNTFDTFNSIPFTRTYPTNGALE